MYNNFENEIKLHLFNVINGLAPLILDCRISSGNDTREKCFASNYNQCWRRLLNICCNFFKHPSPDTIVSTSPSRGEVTRLLRYARNDIHCLGRSMIEMLGVLAIVGVLSVGGIAGYSKAMTKFKINKAIDEVNTIVSNTKIIFANSKTIKFATADGASDYYYDEEDFEFMRNFIMPKETDTGVKRGSENIFYNPFGGEIFTNPADDGIIIYLDELPREACIALGSYDWKDVEDVSVSSVSGGGETAHLSTQDCQAIKNGIDVGPSYNGDGLVGRCKYNNDILPMSPDLAAKGCSCTSNTCQVSVMFP